MIWLLPIGLILLAVGAGIYFVKSDKEWEWGSW